MTGGTKPVTGSIPTIKVDLASPQSPESVSVVDEFKKSGNEQEDEDGLVMKPTALVTKKDGTGEDDKEPQQRLQRCLSDPGPSAEDEEDEPFLP